ncbi:unnamed protein product [Rotaria magnacalcarata]|uniref:RRM domain-containing protein n=1 Tax=Rotaria magnacalcarata TaxID=392030 RepID=A0A816ZDY2_9BILA|nr:unnamed protein product [Rotaria magnacalcarata]CAF2205850.1 unnamed protein product [Rotaria magnacalcarata]
MGTVFPGRPSPPVSPSDDIQTNADNKYPESLRLILLDDSEDNEGHRNTEEELRSIINHLEKFQDINKCQQYIENESQKYRFVLIVSGRLGKEIVPSIDKIRQVRSIYVFCMNQAYHKEWTWRFKKVKAVVVELDELVSRIKSDHKIQIKVKDPLSINIWTASAGKSTTGVNGKFIFSQVLIDCLLQLKSTGTDKNELIDCCKSQYKNDDFELKNLHEFEQDYSPNEVLWWYTKESFFYKTLNEALRTEDIHMIFLFRAFISDIRDQLKEYQVKNSLKVYRSQKMSSDELTILQQSIDQFISVNSFFSTSTDYQKAVSFLDDADKSSNLERVLFEIDADPAVVTAKPFADVSPFSDYPDESEVLFMLGSIFRLESINRNNDQIWIIRMTLCRDDEHHLKHFFDSKKQEIGSGETNLQTLGKLLWKMGKNDLAKKYFCRLLEELPPNDPSLRSLYDNLADLASQAGNFEESLVWHSKSLAFYRDNPIANPSMLNENEIFISGLPSDMEKQRLFDTLRDMFSTVGSIKSDTLTEKPCIYLFRSKDDTTQLTGEATVTFEKKEIAEKAFENYNGKELEPQASGIGHVGDTKKNITNKIFICGLPRNMSEEQLLRQVSRVFSTVGRIQVKNRTGEPDIVLFKAKFNNNQLTGTATITYEKEEAAMEAITKYNEKCTPALSNARLSVKTWEMKTTHVTPGLEPGPLPAEPTLPDSSEYL